jgi:3',5'-cyclic AMP phosphodiesterase CpdA
MNPILAVSQIMLDSPILPNQSKSSPAKLIFLADTQAPMWIEKAYLQYNDNEKATALLFSKILEEQNVSAVIHGGDLTSFGSSQRSWSRIRPFLDSLHARSIPFLAVKGNHDYFFAASAAMRNFKKYVPESSNDYSARAFGPVVVILLNSNFLQLQESSISRQKAWYASTMDDYEKESVVRFIITVDHHPPFTNGEIVSWSEEVRRDFLPPFFNSPKSVVFIAGHAHRFEHFRKRGKEFLVIGGGGGLLHGSRRNPVEHDLYEGAVGGKFFHYLRCSASSNSLLFEVVKVSPNSTQTEIVHRFTLLPPRPLK